MAFHGIIAWSTRNSLKVGSNMNLWSVHGVSVEFPWSFRGKAMEFRWPWVMRLRLRSQEVYTLCMLCPFAFWPTLCSPFRADGFASEGPLQQQPRRCGWPVAGGRWSIANGQ